MEHERGLGIGRMVDRPLRRVAYCRDFHCWKVGDAISVDECSVTTIQVHEKEFARVSFQEEVFARDHRVHYDAVARLVASDYGLVFFERNAFTSSRAILELDMCHKNRTMRDASGAMREE